jgi:hypothetical protein
MNASTINGRPGGHGLADLGIESETFEKVPTVKAVKVEEKVQIETRHDLMVALPGDFILEHPDGHLSVMPEAEFAGSYRPVKAARKKVAA